MSTLFFKVNQLLGSQIRYFHTRKHAAKNELMDLSTLPPCNTSLILRVERPNSVEKLWKLSSISLVYPPNVREHGWDNNADIDWIVDNIVSF